MKKTITQISAIALSFYFLFITVGIWVYSTHCTMMSEQQSSIYIDTHSEKPHKCCEKSTESQLPSQKSCCEEKTNFYYFPTDGFLAPNQTLKIEKISFFIFPNLIPAAPTTACVIPTSQNLTSCANTSPPFTRSGSLILIQKQSFRI
ncbi:MAG: hypothetical protein EAZ55_08335 [Cytophagales bacterium]|nr:MAG: hypothetical protein EAZ55_08335 [Cytophagales bacterium]